MKIYLDLLPKQKKLEIRRKKRFRMLLRHEVIFLFPIFLFVVILLNVYYLVSLQRDISVAEYSAVESQDKFQELSGYEDKFKKVNEASALLSKIQKNQLHWGNVFDRLSAVMPEGIALTGFSTKNYKIFLVGKAKDRDILLSFKNNLVEDQCFENVNVPLSNLVVKENIEFQIDLSIKQECLNVDIK